MKERKEAIGTETCEGSPTLKLYYRFDYFLGFFFFFIFFMKVHIHFEMFLFMGLDVYNVHLFM